MLAKNKLTKKRVEKMKAIMGLFTRKSRERLQFTQLWQ